MSAVSEVRAALGERCQPKFSDGQIEAMLATAEGDVPTAAGAAITAWVRTLSDQGMALYCGPDNVMWPIPVRNYGG